MNYSGKRRRILHLAVSLVAALALWLLFKKDEPRYQGKTAQEWFNAAGKKQVSESEFRKALEVLSTNFLPEIMAFAEGNHRASWFIKWPFYLPYSFRPKLQAPAYYPHYDFLAKEGIAYLGRLSTSRDHLPALQKLFRNASFRQQERLMWFLYCYSTGRTSIKGSETPAINGQLDFAPRLCEALALAPITGVQESVQTNLLAPVLVEALTNMTMMKAVFGASSAEWQMMASRELKGLAPQIAEKYRDYLKE